ncbi:WXG100 family type VII secretion target [Streptomyces roseoverticillatus]|uniref:WXG100 family type VII secretion target n=1 Tax=Streptomyces roseoverticillatus TaxID=66429 RepID=A0ABV3IP97_9ACTN
MSNDRLAATDKELSDLVRDLGSMVKHLERKIRHLNELVGSVDHGWQSAAASAYKELQKSVNQDAARIRKSLILIKEAVELSRDGFSRQDLEILHRFQQIQKSMADVRDPFGAPAHTGTPPQAGTPRSTLDHY